MRSHGTVASDTSGTPRLGQHRSHTHTDASPGSAQARVMQAQALTLLLGQPDALGGAGCACALNDIHGAS